MSETVSHPARRQPRYGVVFLVLAALTAIELAVGGSRLDPRLLVPALLALAFAKAGLVAAYYMHLRGDHRLYTAVFVLPALLLLVFALLSIAI